MNKPVAEMPVLRLDEKQGPQPAPAEPDRTRVLLVDDDDRNLLALKTVLEDLGEVVLARSGEEALRHLLQGEFARSHEHTSELQSLMRLSYAVFCLKKKQ